MSILVQNEGLIRGERERIREREGRERERKRI